VSGGPGSSAGIATGYGLDGPGIEFRWGRDFPHLSRPAVGPPSLQYNGYRVFPGGKVRPGRAADHSPPSSAVVMEENYTSTHPLGHTGPVTGLHYLYIYINESIICCCQERTSEKNFVTALN
jgi:hypothetical protein